jgi:glycosyltransferase 2 family protein
VSNRVLMVGFSAGLFATFLSFTPAAIGLMEGSMAGSFYLMGLDYDVALLATLIFRFAYYFLPIMVSFCFYRRFFPPGTKHSEARIASRPLSSLDRSPEQPRGP